MPDSAEPRDIELMRRLSSGDEGAFLEFYRRHQGGVYRYAVHMTGRPEAAADVVQETFLTLIRQAGKFDEEKGAPGAFLYGIARNHVRKLQYKESRYVALGEESDDAPTGNGTGGNQNGNGYYSGNPGQTETALWRCSRYADRHLCSRRCQPAEAGRAAIFCVAQKKANGSRTATRVTAEKAVSSHRCDADRAARGSGRVCTCSQPLCHA